MQTFSLYQVRIDVNLADIIENDSYLLLLCICEDVLDQGGLPRTQEARKNNYLQHSRAMIISINTNRAISTVGTQQLPQQQRLQ